MPCLFMFILSLTPKKRRACLCSPALRLTAAQALAHPYFASLHDPGDEPAMPLPLPSDPELDSMPVSQVREGIWEEMVRYRPSLVLAR